MNRYRFFFAIRRPLRAGDPAAFAFAFAFALDLDLDFDRVFLAPAAEVPRCVAAFSDFGAALRPGLPLAPGERVAELLIEPLTFRPEGA